MNVLSVVFTWAGTSITLPIAAMSRIKTFRTFRLYYPIILNNFICFFSLNVLSIDEFEEGAR